MKSEAPPSHINDLVVELDKFCEERRAEYGIKIYTSTECAWCCEIRITPFPNEIGCDRSLVVMKTGDSDPEEVVNEAVYGAKEMFKSVRLKDK